MSPRDTAKDCFKDITRKQLLHKQFASLRRPSATLGDPRCDPPKSPSRRLFENPEKRRPAPSTANPSPLNVDVVGAIFPGRRGVGNAVCRNFLFPLGWPACGVNSSLPAGGGLRNFDAPSLRSTRRDVGGVLGEVRERGTVTFAVTTVSPRNGAYTTAALPPTVPDQMTRASAHNNGLFTLQSYPIPKPRPGIPAPLSTDLDGSALPQFERAGVQYRSSGSTEFESRECRSDLRIQKNFKRRA